MDFCDVFDDVTKEGRKLQTSEYLENGLHPIYDQGQNEVAGYTNETEGLFTNTPVILFGDHTRVVKYVDTPCFLGADGVKLLKPKIQNVNAKYLFYAVRSVQIPNTGYNRHFKWLKEATISIPAKEEQDKIVAILDETNHLISLRKNQLQKLDDLIKARFVEMFGDPMTNDKGYELKRYGDVFELNAGGTPSKTHPEYWEGGTISWIGSNMCQDRYIYENDGKFITQKGYDNSSARLFPIDTVLVALVGATIGKTALLKFETTTNQNVLGIRGIRESGYLPEFVYYYTQGLYKKFIGISDGGFSMASKGFISELPIPIVPLALQEEFTGFADQVDKSKLSIQQGLEKLETLKKSLMQQYFG